MESDPTRLSDYTAGIRGLMEQKDSVEISLAKDIVKKHSDHDLKADDHRVKEKEMVNIDVDKHSVSAEETELELKNGVQRIGSQQNSRIEKNKSADDQQREKSDDPVSEITVSENGANEDKDSSIGFEDKNCDRRPVMQDQGHYFETHKTVHSEDYQDYINLKVKIGNTDVTVTQSNNDIYISTGRRKMDIEVLNSLRALKFFIQNKSHFPGYQPVLPFQCIQVQGSSSIMICNPQLCHLIHSAITTVLRMQADQVVVAGQTTGLFHSSVAKTAFGGGFPKFGASSAARTSITTISKPLFGSGQTVFSSTPAATTASTNGTAKLIFGTGQPSLLNMSITTYGTTHLAFKQPLSAGYNFCMSASGGSGTTITKAPVFGMTSTDGSPFRFAVPPSAQGFNFTSETTSSGATAAAAALTTTTTSTATTASLGTFNVTNKFDSGQGFNFTGSSATIKSQASATTQGAGTSLDSMELHQKPPDTMGSKVTKYKDDFMHIDLNKKCRKGSKIPCPDRWTSTLREDNFQNSFSVKSSKSMLKMLLTGQDVIGLVTFLKDTKQGYLIIHQPKNLSGFCFTGEKGSYVSDMWYLNFSTNNFIPRNNICDVFAWPFHTEALSPRILNTHLYNRYQYEYYRVSTFHTYSGGNFRIRLAQAGFTFDTETETVMCPWCDVLVHGRMNVLENLHSHNCEFRVRNIPVTPSTSLNSPADCVAYGDVSGLNNLSTPSQTADDQFFHTASNRIEFEEPPRAVVHREIDPLPAPLLPCSIRHATYSEEQASGSTEPNAHMIVSQVVAQTACEQSVYGVRSIIAQEHTATVSCNGRNNPMSAVMFAFSDENDPRFLEEKPDSPSLYHGDLQLSVFLSSVSDSDETCAKEPYTDEPAVPVDISTSIHSNPAQSAIQRDHNNIESSEALERAFRGEHCRYLQGNVPHEIGNETDNGIDTATFEQNEAQHSVTMDQQRNSTLADETSLVFPGSQVAKRHQQPEEIAVSIICSKESSDNTNNERFEAVFSGTVPINPNSFMEEHQESPGTSLCKICFVNISSRIFFPCGHLVTCSGCASACTRCPVCRKCIKRTIQ